MGQSCQGFLWFSPTSMKIFSRSSFFFFYSIVLARWILWDD